MSSWQRRQVIRVLRRRMAIKCIHAGFSRRPGLLRSASLRTWWTSRFTVSSQSSQRPARSRWISSVRRALAMPGRWSVRAAVPERDPAEAGDQWFPPPVAFHGDLQAPAGSGGCLDCGLVLPSHRGDRRTVLACQRLEQRGLHDPVEAAQAEHVLGQEVVLDKTGVLGLILRDDGEIVVVKQRATLRWFSFAHVKRAPLPDDGPRHEQPDRPVDRPAVAGDLGVGVLGTDLVAEEARRLAGSVRDQRRGLRQLQLEFLAQERRDLLLDVLGLALWTGEPQQPVGGLADIPEPPVSPISGVLARELAAAQGEPARFRLVLMPAGPLDRVLHSLIRPVAPTAAAQAVLGPHPFLDVLIP